MFRNRQIIIGFLLVLFGFIAPFLMVLKLIPSSFWLSFLSHGASVSGLFLGLIGASNYIQVNKKKS
jgi:hypothetical protein